MDFVFPHQPNGHDECMVMAPQGTWGHAPPPAEGICGQGSSSDQATFYEWSLFIISTSCDK